MTGTVTPVGEKEIAQRLGVKPNTAHAWRKRGLLPEPEWTVSGQPAWDWSSIVSWAQATGRMRQQALPI